MITLDDHTRAVIAMLTCAAACADVDPEPVRLIAIALGAVCADDTSCAHQGVWMLKFGAYGTYRVVACGHLEDALEDAARLVPPGMFTEPDYAGAARSLGLPEDPDACTDKQLDRVRSLAECDLTETESGWLPSWEISAWECACE